MRPPAAVSSPWLSPTSSTSGPSTRRAVRAAAWVLPLASRNEGLSRSTARMITISRRVARPKLTKVPRQPEARTRAGPIQPATVPPSGVPTDRVLTATGRKRSGSHSVAMARALE